MKRIINKLIASALCLTFLFAGISCKKKGVESEDATKFEIVNGEYLYREGVSDYCILIRDDANSYESFAAQELTQILHAATGTSLSIVNESQLKNDKRVISLGHTKLWDKKVGMTLSREDIIDSGYYIKTVENNIYISCPDNTSSSGVLYGVYDFLKDIVDYEFYAVTEVQYNETKEIPLVKYAGHTVNPSFEMRHLRNADLRDDELTVKRYRMVYPSLAFGMATWGHGQIYQYIHPDHECTCGQAGCGNGITYYEHHSDWFASYNTKNLQLCWSAGDGLEEVTAKKFIEYFQMYPDAEYFMFGQEDVDSQCSCARCTKAISDYAGNHAGLQIAFMNNVIKKTTKWLEENQPGRYVKYVIYAYYKTKNAPVVKDNEGNIKVYSDKVDPADNLYIFYAPIYANFAFQIDSNENADVYKDLKEWSAIADGQIIMYLYDINFRNYFINFNNFGTAKGMYETCKELGVACMTSQAADSYTACFQEMRSYVESSLMWDLSLSYDDLVRKFMKAYYKDAWENIYEYYQIVRDRYAYYQNVVDSKSGGIYGDINNNILWTQPILDKIDVQFDQALAKIEVYKTSDPELYTSLKNRIMKERLTPYYIKITTLSSYYSKEELAQIKAEFKYYANLFKFQEVSEGGAFGNLLD